MDGSLIPMLIETKNAQLAGRSYLEIANSKVRENMAKLLQREGLIKAFNVFKEGKFKRLHIDLLTEEEVLFKPNNFRCLKLISRPGQRIYYSSSDIGYFLKKGRISMLLSTSKGLMSIKESRKRSLGGEAICEFSEV